MNNNFSNWNTAPINNYSNWNNQAPMNYNANQLSRSFISGRLINNPNEMKPQDVPSDGTPAFFPVYDGSCIYVKYWDNNCNLKTSKYVLVNNEVSFTEDIKDPIQTIMDRLDQIESKLNERKPYNKQNGGENK